MRTASPAVIWHELECGRYRADLPLWRGLAAEHPGPILDLGAGTGRVSIDLASRGQEVTALDRDAEALDELARRAQLADVPVATVIADAREFELDQRFGLILVPMQTIQLLDGAGRDRLLRRAAAHLRSPGRLAAAITEEFDLYDEDTGDAGRLPTPDVTEISGTVYVSQATAVRRSAESFILERRRETLSADGGRVVESHQERLYALSAGQLQVEAERAGLRPAGRSEIPANSEHVGSVVVMLDA